MPEPISFMKASLFLW